MCGEQCGRSVVGTDNWRCRAMQTRRFIMRTFAAVLAIAATALTGCAGSGGDKAGGAKNADPHVLTMAVQTGVPDQMSVFAEEVRRLSEGTLEITFDENWRLGEALYEAGTLEDVKAGKVDMAWVGARAFDTVGIKSFQSLLAPLLIDSYDLEAKVFEEGIPDDMLEVVAELDLVGIGVLPGPMRKVLGVSRPFVEVADFYEQVIGIQDSAVAKQTLGAIGAVTKAVPAKAPLGGLDGYEQQLASIAGNSYDASAKYVTSNLNLWPRPLVIVMGNDAYESLTEAQRSVLRDAAEAAIPKALEASRAEDEEAVAMLCKRGMSFATASASNLAKLRAAFEPVYSQLTSDPDTRSYVDAIESIKQEIAASPEAPGCASVQGVPASAGIPDGIYETTVTRADYARWGVEVQNTGVFTLEFTDGRVISRAPSGGVGFDAPYTLFRDKFEAGGDPDTLRARWTFDGRKLEFKDFAACTGSPCVSTGEFDYHVVFASHPWVLRRAKRAPIDGTYETTITRADWVHAGVDGETTGVFTLELTEGTVILREPSGDVGFQAPYTLFRDKFEAVGDPDTLTARWSFDGTSLRFTNLGVCGGSGCAPSDEVTPYHVVWESHPWTRVD
jgi:TRAP-type C4-dicarboxylate transport system substrate-binding protein